MTNLNLGQDVANKRNKNRHLLIYMAKSYPLWEAQRIYRYSSPIYINLSSVCHEP